nr:immunoglobulin light chain junction region [Macaca mulatta]MOW73709.1 immunoglobulin light chain junction region [Macaca mulatta]MOW74057.1 immunoglobulin light chain junction region [Macaca mulatta]MOW74936.1 immunoglobulin light chain junction region [Macaca mulatta]MOW75021.1 immunoglobulin light chain junction region [Macaca mulatta]
CQQHYNYPYSF